MRSEECCVIRSLGHPGGRLAVQEQSRQKVPHDWTARQEEACGIPRGIPSMHSKLDRADHVPRFVPQRGSWYFAEVSVVFGHPSVENRV